MADRYATELKPRGQKLLAEATELSGKHMYRVIEDALDEYIQARTKPVCGCAIGNPGPHHAQSCSKYQEPL